ncbi:MAG: HAD-IIB family hydrolase, partial [Actinomycetes bacterium]
RAPLSMSWVLRKLDLPRNGQKALTVASNGAVTFSYPPMEVVSEVTFDAREAVRTVLAEVPEAAVAVEEHGVGYRVNRHFPEGELDGEMILTPIAELVAAEVSRVIIRDPESTSEDFVSLAQSLGLHGTNYFIGWTAWLDLAPEGVSKASGLAQVAEKLGVDRADVLAIGDGRNDIEMLEWAGRGVAMGQSPDEVKAAADAVTASVEEDGAAIEINRWF